MACQCGVRIAPGLTTIRLIDMPDRIGKVSPVARVIESRSDCSTISPSVSEMAFWLRETVMADASAETRLIARKTVTTVR